MKFVIAFIGLFVAVNASTIILPATTLIRSPAHDSAIVQSERIGGSFSYSTLEGHAYKAIAPVIQYDVRPLVYTSLGQQVIYQQPLATQYIIPSGGAIIGAIPELKPDKLEGRSDEPKPEEKKEENEDSVVVESA